MVCFLTARLPLGCNKPENSKHVTCGKFTGQLLRRSEVVAQELTQHIYPDETYAQIEKQTLTLRGSISCAISASVAASSQFSSFLPTSFMAVSVHVKSFTLRQNRTGCEPIANGSVQPNARVIHVDLLNWNAARSSVSSVCTTTSTTTTTTATTTTTTTTIHALI